MKRAMRVICAALIVITAFSILATSAVFAKEDYSYSEAISKTDVYADEFLAEYLGYELSQVESDFLHYESDFLFSYNSSIPTSVVKSDYSDGTLKLSAANYRYTASNGAEVVWTPISATVNGVTKQFTETTRVLYFTDASESDTATVLYASSFIISEERVNELLEAPYESAPKLMELIDEKRAEYEKYLSDLDKHSEYLSALALYNEYLSEMKLYGEELAAYNAYLESFDEYLAQLRKYADYLAAYKKYEKENAEYQKYLAYAEDNQAKIEAYESYLEKRDTAKYQLEIIKITKTPISVKNAPDRTVYGAIMGDTVDRVIREKDLIIERLDGDAAVIDMAGVATQNLKNLLTGFFNIHNTAGQYNYYITNYNAFRDNFANLLRALENLYCIPEIRGIMMTEDKHEKYLVLVAQLYYIANALSDSPIQSVDGSFYFDSSYKIGMFYKEDYKRTPVAAALENQEFIEDKNNAKPLEGYPTEPEKPEYLTVEKPTMPEYMQEPVMPEEVEEPTMPTAVTKPSEVLNPDPVAEYKPTAVVQALIEAYKNGEIQPREAYTGGDVPVEVQISVNKKYQNVESVTVTFFDKEYSSTDERNALYTVTIDKGTSADYLGEKPEKPEDADYSYEFCGWTDSDGNAVDLTRVEADIAVYPKFTKHDQEYEVFWVVDENTVSSYPGVPELPDLEYYEYDYGWGEPEVDIASGTKTYSAEFIESKPLVSAKNGFIAKVRRSDGNLIFAVNSSVEVYDISNLIERASGSYGVVISLADGAEMRFSLAETVALKRAGVDSIRIRTGATLGLEALDESGEAISANLKLMIKAPFVSDDPSHLRVFYTDGGEKVYVRHQILADSASVVSFEATAGRGYAMRTEYTLTAATLDGVEIRLNKTTALAGESIGVVVNASPGIRIDKIYYESSDGAKEIISNSSFKMPARDVVVGVEYTAIVYTVSFVSDGMTLYTGKFTYGSTITVPDDPTKAASAEYSYEFIGWSPEVKTTVTGDATYFAQYNKIPVSQTDDQSGGISGVVLKLLRLADVGAICILTIAIPSLIMRHIVLKKRKKYVFKIDNGDK